MTRAERLISIFDTTFYPSFEEDGNDTVESLILYGLVRFLCPITCVELGSWKGYSAIWTAKALIDNGLVGKLWCVDAFIGMGKDCRQEFLSNIEKAEVDYVITLIHKLMKDAVNDVPEEIDFLYVDGNTKDTFSDLSLYSPRINKGGVILIHDVRDGINKAKLSNSFRRVNLPTRQGLWMGVKI